MHCAITLDLISLISYHNYLPWCNLLFPCLAGSIVEEGLQWSVNVNSPGDVRAQRINKSLAALLTLRWRPLLPLLHAFSHHNTDNSLPLVYGLGTELPSWAALSDPWLCSLGSTGRHLHGQLPAFDVWAVQGLASQACCHEQPCSHYHAPTQSCPAHECGFACSAAKCQAMALQHLNTKGSEAVAL